MIPMVSIIFAVIIGPSYLILRIEPGYFLGIDAYSPLTSPFLSLLVCSLPFLFGELLVRSVRRTVVGLEPGEQLPRSFSRALRLFRMTIVLVYAVSVYFLHWPRVIEDYGIKGWVLVDKIVVLIPFGVALLGSWITTYRVQRVVRPGEGTTLKGFLLFQLRVTALPILPLGLVVLLVDIVENTDPLRVLFEQFPYLVWISVFAFLVCVFLFMPLALRWIWSVKPLEDGPLRRELDRFSTELKFRCRDILVWKTEGELINAAIIGLVSPLRYVILTDGLLGHLGLPEIRAVFAHEVGHARKHHIPLYFVFSASFIFLFLSLEQHFLPGSGEDSKELILFLFLWSSLFVIYWWLILGFISRRFECQADLFGAESVGDPSIFVQALEKISDLSGNVRTKRSWRHFSVAQRVAFLQGYFRNPPARKHFRVVIRVMMTLFWSMAFLTLGVAAADVREQHVFGLAQRAFSQGRYELAEQHCIQALAIDEHDVRYWHLLGRIKEGLGRSDEAIDAYQKGADTVARGGDERRRSCSRAVERLETLGTRSESSGLD